MVLNKVGVYLIISFVIPIAADLIKDFQSRGDLWEADAIYPDKG
ncbi:MULTISPECIES: hypothetical protein [unclassified Pseudoalteromonas]|nr:hypothetical protein [Pseudoalteromonas sp. NCCP-2140]GKW53043.1 hypothetical protein NCCP2140_20960 [Pseudoalteromonas sp. NCCP-2140]